MMDSMPSASAKALSTSPRICHMTAGDNNSPLSSTHSKSHSTSTPADASPVESISANSFHSKNGIATVTEESITAWYRLTAKAACGDGDTTGNTASQLQVEFMPVDVVQDKIFYSALLSSAQQVTVTVGGVDLGAKWTHTPSDPVGIYHGSVAFGSNTGPVKITVGGMVFTGESITTSCTRASGQDGLTNFNAWVGSQSGGAVHATPTLTMSEQVCIEGTGAAGFSELCEFTCQYSYCPPGACYCTKMGPQKDLPTEKNNPLFGTVGYPAAGLSADYSGLCEYACNYGYCPDQYCSTTSSPLVTPLSSPFDPPACTSGSGSGDLGGLCSYACNFGYCPIRSVSHPLRSYPLHQYELSSLIVNIQPTVSLRNSGCSA